MTSRATRSSSSVTVSPSLTALIMSRGERTVGSLSGGERCFVQFASIGIVFPAPLSPVDFLWGRRPHAMRELLIVEHPDGEADDVGLRQAHLLDQRAYLVAGLWQYVYVHWCFSLPRSLAVLIGVDGQRSHDDHHHATDNYGNRYADEKCCQAKRSPRRSSRRADPAAAGLFFSVVARQAVEPGVCILCVSVHAAGPA